MTAVAFRCRLVRTSLANLCGAGVERSLNGCCRCPRFCGYPVGYQRQLGADALLAKKTRTGRAWGGGWFAGQRQQNGQILGNQSGSLLELSGNSDFVQAVIELSKNFESKMIILYESNWRIYDLIVRISFDKPFAYYECSKSSCIICLRARLVNRIRII